MFHNYITTLKNNEITGRAYNKWTLKEDLQLIKEVDDKKTFKEIALMHKRTFGAIKSRVIASIIYFRYNQGDTDIDSLSREYNIEKIAIEKYIEKMNIKNNEETCCTYSKWKPEEDIKLIKEIAEKKTYDYIALEHKRTLIAIKYRTISLIIYPEYKNGNTDIDRLSREYNIEKEMIENYIEKMDNNNNENTSRSFSKWTVEEDIKLIQEIAEKKTYYNIALEHKRALLVVKYRIISLIIYPEYKNGNTDIDRLSREYNIEKEMIENYIKKNNCNRDNENIELNAKYDTILLLLEYNIVSIEKKLDSVIKIIQK
jgi:hypothetical protein